MKKLGRLTIYFRANNVSDAVEAAVVRKQRKAAKMQAKAKAQAKKMIAVDVALQTTLCDTRTALNGEIASFGASKMPLLTFLQDQYRSRLVLQKGLYKTIPLLSEFRMKQKPFKLRMKPHASPGENMKSDEQISYLTRLLHVMIEEDQKRSHEPTVRLEDTQLVRRLPVISVAYLNPESLRLKKIQEAAVAAIAQPQDNPWYGTLAAEYLGKILYDRKTFYRVFAIQYVQNIGKNVYPCWEATTEPVYKDEHGQFVVHDRHLVLTSDGSKKLLESAEVRTLSLTLPLTHTRTMNLTKTLTYNPNP